MTIEANGYALNAALFPNVAVIKASHNTGKLRNTTTGKRYVIIANEISETSSMYEVASSPTLVTGETKTDFEIDLKNSFGRKAKLSARNS